jgi:PilZ domain-containing protein
MPKGKQTSRRARRRIEVRYGPDEPQFIGYSGNVSRSGIMVRAIRVFAPGTVLHLELKFPDGTFRLRGEVVWARQGPVQFLSTGRVGMGINFLEPPAEFLGYVERLSAAQ